jgi:hypothetical protein
MSADEIRKAKERQRLLGALGLQPPPPPPLPDQLPHGDARPTAKAGPSTSGADHAHARRHYEDSRSLHDDSRGMYEDSHDRGYDDVAGGDWRMREEEQAWRLRGKGTRHGLMRSTGGRGKRGATWYGKSGSGPLARSGAPGYGVRDLRDPMRGDVRDPMHGRRPEMRDNHSRMAWEDQNRARGGYQHEASTSSRDDYMHGNRNNFGHVRNGPSHWPADASEDWRNNPAGRWGAPSRDENLNLGPNDNGEDAYDPTNAIISIRRPASPADSWRPPPLGAHLNLIFMLVNKPS